MGFSRFFRKFQPFQHIGLWNFDKVNIFKINKCKKIFFEKFPFFRGVALIKKIFFGQNFFARVSGKNKTFVKKKFFLFFFGVLTRAKKVKNIPESWNLGSRLNFGQLKTWQSPNSTFFIFKWRPHNMVQC